MFHENNLKNKQIQTPVVLLSYRILCCFSVLLCFPIVSCRSCRYGNIHDNNDDILYPPLHSQFFQFDFRVVMADDIAETQQKNQTKFIEEIGKTLFNNKDYSDITFVVNKKHYYASEIVMSAASKVFKSLIKEKEHLKNGTDWEILILGIKYEESFFYILKYIHGFDIDLSTINKLVLCELIHLTEHYKLNKFHTDLKDYVSKLKQFNVHSVSPMLNTVSTYNLSSQYENLKMYVYQHSKEILSHESFVNLNYDILLDLLKSDWLFCKEIDILRAALSWYDNVVMNVAIVKDIDMETNTNETRSKLFDSVNQKDEIDSDNANANKSSRKGYTEVKGLTENLNLTIIDNIEVAINKSKNFNKKGGSVAIVSQNILKTLMSHIRFARIPMSDYLNYMNTEIFIKYKDYILNENNKPKLKTSERFIYCEVACLRKFTIKNTYKNETKDGTVRESDESFMIGNYTWRVLGQIEIINDKTYLGLYLIYISELDTGNVLAEFLLTLVSHDYLLDDKSVSQKADKHAFTKNMDSWGWPQFISYSKLLDPNAKYITDNDTITIEAVISIIPPRSDT